MACDLYHHSLSVRAIRLRWTVVVFARVFFMVLVTMLLFFAFKAMFPAAGPFNTVVRFDAFTVRTEICIVELVLLWQEIYPDPLYTFAHMSICLICI